MSALFSTYESTQSYEVLLVNIYKSIKQYMQCFHLIYLSRYTYAKNVYDL